MRLLVYFETCRINFYLNFFTEKAVTTVSWSLHGLAIYLAILLINTEICLVWEAQL